MFSDFTLEEQVNGMKGKIFYSNKYSCFYEILNISKGVEKPEDHIYHVLLFNPAYEGIHIHFGKNQIKEDAHINDIRPFPYDCECNKH